MRFTDPPDKHRRRMSFDWDTIYAEITANPGQWLLIAEPGYMSTYNAITQSKTSNFLPSMGVEMRTANSGDYQGTPRMCDLYVRYNPDKDTSLTVKQREAKWREIRRIEKEKKEMVSTVESNDEEQT